MKRLAAILSLTLICLAQGAKAQDLPVELTSILYQVPDHLVELDYSFSIVKDKVPVLFSGHAVLQSNCFHISGNGLEIYCNGDTIEYRDYERKEAYIESAVRLEDYIKDNIGSVKDFKATNVKVSPPTGDASLFNAPAPGDGWVSTDLR